MEYLLLHNREYSSRLAKNNFKPSTEGIWCWAVNTQDLGTFYHVYKDISWVAVRPRSTARLVAFPHSLRGGCEDYAMGRQADSPVREEFQAPLHCVVLTKREVFCHCGCERSEGIFPWFETPYAVWIEGKVLRRRTQAIRRLRQKRMWLEEERWDDPFPKRKRKKQ
jgi:hypothetical protein